MRSFRLFENNNGWKNYLFYFLFLIQHQLRYKFVLLSSTGISAKIFAIYSIKFENHWGKDQRYCSLQNAVWNEELFHGKTLRRGNLFWGFSYELCRNYGHLRNSRNFAIHPRLSSRRCAPWSAWPTLPSTRYRPADHALDAWYHCLWGVFTFVIGCSCRTAHVR